MFLKEESLDLGNTFFKHLPTPSFMTDNKGKIVWCSQEAVKQLGYSINDLQDMDVPFFTDYTQGHITANWETILQTEDPFEISPVVLYSKDRIAIKTSIVAKSFSWQDTRYVLFQIKTDTNNLMESSSFHELQLIKKGLSNSYMIVYIDPEGLIMHANDKFLKKSAWTPKRIVGKSFWQLLPDTPENMAIGNQIITRLRDGKVFQGSVEKITKDGTTFWVNLLAIPVHNTQNNTPYFLLLEDEITEKKLMQTKLEQIAYVDTETGLLSRHRLEEVVNEYINEKKSFSFVFIGIDQFYTLKEIFNDQTETKMLNEFTKRLKIYFEDSIIARSGRDDFAIVTPLSDWYIQGFANYLKQNPIYLDSKIIPITVSGAITDIRKISNLTSIC